MKEVVGKFRMMQFGFSVFLTRDAESFSAYSFSAYLYPLNDKKDSKDFALNLNAMKFHKENHFDFNKWIYEGLPLKGFAGAAETTDSFFTAMANKTSNESEDEDDAAITDSSMSDKLSEAHASKLFQILRDFRAPIIGHNLLIDLMFLYSNFVGPLPNYFKTFKYKLRSVFPLFTLSP